LAIVKQLVETQGGSISVKSELNAGSVFSFDLQFKKTDKEVELEGTNKELESKHLDIKVLVVEDVPLNQLLMRAILDDFVFYNWH
jgi:two-component system, chemotaxis family, CheB/CheR fusion protein